MTTATVGIPVATAQRAAEWRYLLELIANGDDVKLMALARLYGWAGPFVDQTHEGNKLSAIRQAADVLTLPFG